MSQQMGQWKIQDLENRLSCRLRRNTLSLGFDVAKQITGVAILATTDDEVLLVHTSLINTKDSKVITDCMDDFEDKVDDLFSRVEFIELVHNRFIIEDCFLGYAGKFPLVTTFRRLCEFHTLIYSKCRHLSSVENRYFISATDARSRLGIKIKRKTKKTPEVPDTKVQVAMQLKDKFDIEFDSFF